MSRSQDMLNRMLGQSVDHKQAVKRCKETVDARAPGDGPTMVLTRTVGQHILLTLPGGELISVTYTSHDRGHVRLAITAPTSIKISRVPR